MNDAQIQNIIDFENALARIHIARAKQMKAYLADRRKKRALQKAHQMTEGILGKLSATSKE